jgi:O-acetyl-ADP-ribose deacetylase (regulator of RNase III)
MIRYQKGDLLSVTSGIIAHGCNCQGVMGSGVAFQIKKKWPEVYKQYKLECDSFTDQQLLGSKGRAVKVDDDLYVVNLYTQLVFGADGRKYVSYDAIDKSFKYFLHENAIGNFGNKKHQINIPLIGAGLGGGNWTVIESIIKSRAKEFSTEVIVWEYDKI